MAEYIEREALKAEFMKHYTCEYPATLVMAIIDNVSTADVEVVRHGKWIGKYNTIQYNDWMCSYCGKYESETRNKDRLGNYCRWCGAKMDLE